MTVIQPRRGTSAQWENANPILAVGELGYESDTRRSKRGDGSTPWNNLPYDDTGAFGRAPLSGGGVFAGIDAALSPGGTSAAIQIQGDSTGNANDEWVYLLAEWIGQRHPTAAVKYKVWNDATNDYGAWTTIQPGTSGARYALFKGVNATRTMYQYPQNIPTITGDIDIRVHVTMDNWTPDASQCLVARYGGAGERCWRLSVNSSGRPDFIWTENGTDNIQRVPNAGFSFTNGSAGWVRITLDVDDEDGNHVFKAYESSDGVSWSQVGGTVTTAGVTSIYDAAGQNYEIGVRGLTGEPLAGRIHEVQIRDGIDGPIVNPQPIESWMPRDAASTYEAGSFGGSPTIYIVNGSHPGANVEYLSDEERHPRMVHPYAGSLIFQSCSYNDFDRVDAEYLAARKSWLEQTEERAPGCQVAIVTQGPMTAPVGNNRIVAHARRRNLLTTFAARNGLVVIDTYRRFLEYPTGYANLIQLDGVHPTAADGSGETGEEVWLKAITDAWEQISPL